MVDETTVTTAEANPTTLAAENRDDKGKVEEVFDLDELPAECVDAFAGWLQAMERELEGFDVSTATADDLDSSSNYSRFGQGMKQPPRSSTALIWRPPRALRPLG